MTTLKTCAVAVASVFMLATAGYAQDTLTLIGSGSSAFETPPIAGAGTSSATCTLNRTAATFACTATVFNIVDLTAGHVHVGGPGVAGPVVMNIPSLPLRISDDFTLTWTWTNADLILRPAQGVNKLADVFEACASGNCYLNFHTSANPGGEIRMQLCPRGDGRAANTFYGINACTIDR